MVDIQTGQSFDIQSIRASQGLKFKGKPIQFELIDEDELVFQGRTELTDEEIKAGNVYVDVLTVQFPISQGTVVLTKEAPKQLDKDFKELSDAEKLTKLHSLQYTLGRDEPRQIASGNLSTTIGRAAAKETEKKQKGEDKSQLDKQKETGTSNVIEQQQSAKKGFEDQAKAEENKKNAEHSQVVNKMAIADIQKDTDSKQTSTATATASTTKTSGTGQQEQTTTKKEEKKV